MTESFRWLQWPEYCADGRDTPGIAGGLGSATVNLQYELLYQGVFREQCRHLGVNRLFYPLAGAANYSLLYLVARLVSECPVTTVLDLGAGQTTLLLDALARHRPMHIVTVEEAPDWAARIGGQVSHPVMTAKVVPVSRGDLAGNGYDVAAQLDGQRFDLVIVDGPLGLPRCSRLGSLAVLQTNLAPEFAVIFDDAQRQGEQDTIARARKELSERGVNHQSHRMCGLKGQEILFSPGFGAVAWY